MKILSICSFLFLTLFSVRAQTVDEVINRWVNAMGGREKLESIKTMYTENDVSIMNNPASSKTYTVRGKGYKSEFNFGGQMVIDCYTPDKGWSVNPLAGQATPVSMPESQVKMGQSQLDPAGALFNYAAKGSKVELMGKEKLDDKTVFKIKLTSATGSEIQYFINDSTYYISKMIMPIKANGQDMEIITRFSDYKKTPEGFVVPVGSEFELPGLTMSFTNKITQFNKEIDPAIFEMPKN